MIALDINGRFATQAISGVQRFAASLSTALIEELRDRGQLARAAFCVPARSRLVQVPPGLMPEGIGHLTGHAWEQFDLPRLRTGDWLFSPCNSGPLATSRQIVTIHDAQVYLTPEAYSRAFVGWYRFMHPRLARTARIVTTDSHYSLRQLRHFGVLPPDKGVVVPCGADHIDGIMADTSTLGRHRLESGGFLLAVGSLSPHKNIATIVRAMAAAGPDVLPLVIAGGGDARIFADAGLAASARVRFLGRVTDGELKALYQSARALLFPSFYEGFGLPPIEAMRCGCPVVATTAASVPEVCGTAAILISPHDMQAWIDAIALICRDDRLAADLSERGRAQAATFTWRRSGALLADSLIAAA